MFWLPLPSLLLAFWAAQVFKHFRVLGLPAPFAHDGTLSTDKSSFRAKLAGNHHEVWQGLQASPRSAPSKGAKCAHTTGGLCALGLSLSPFITCP